MNVASRRQCLQLHGIAGLNALTLRRLLLHFRDLDAIYGATAAQLLKLGIDPDIARAVGRSAGCANSDVQQQLDVLEAVDADIITIAEDRYPVLLRAIYDPPPLLYVRGQAETLQRATLAIVGSRRASPAGARAARSLSRSAAAAGLQICSGLAVGIDAQAHQGALDAAAASIAVMATGIERIYPLRHRSLAMGLLQRGCLVSEFAPGSAPRRHHFPRRNRIISGLSLGVLVVEAALPSGSLITATTALDQGREVFALPWSPFHSGGKGCLKLLREGAVMVQNLDDILAELGPLYDCQRELTPPLLPAAASDLSRDGDRVLRSLGYEVQSIEDLLSATSLSVPLLLSVLSSLELRGLAVRQDAGYIRA